MNNNKVLEKFKQHQPSLGTFTHLKSMVAVEALGVTGLDYVVIDMEHSPIAIDEAARFVTAADAVGITPFLRVNEATRSAVLRALDIGVMGIIVPCIETVEQLRQLVGHAKFQPEGNRGYCMTRDGQWGFSPSYRDGITGYMNISNSNTLLIPQCETAGCLEHIEEIASMDGVDGIMIGPYDLSIAMGMTGQFDSPQFQAAVSRILTACKNAGKLSIMFTGVAADAKARLSQGFDSALVGLDVLMLINRYKTLVDDIHR